ncbi:MAG: hypothetical protein ABFS56_10540 [Pseudomonadota bacterium]
MQLVNTTVSPNDDKIYEIFWAVERLRGELTGEKLHLEIQKPFDEMRGRLFTALLALMNDKEMILDVQVFKWIDDA